MEETTIVISHNGRLVDIIAEKMSNRKVISVGISGVESVFREHHESANMLVIGQNAGEKESQSLEEVKKKIVTPVLETIRKAIPFLVNKQWASIVVILPDYQKETRNDFYEGTASFFLQGFIKSLAVELGSKNILVNAIEPEQIIDAEGLAEAIAWFSSERAYMTGQILPMKVACSYSLPVHPVAWITGSGQGIGKAIATELSGDGFLVCMNDIKEDEATKEIINDLHGFPVLGDITDARRMKENVRKTVEHFGHLDVFIANAAYMNMAPFIESSEEQINLHWEVNIQGHMNCLDPVIEQMKRQGYGKIILFSSMFGVLGWKNATGYASTKAAILGLTKYLQRVVGKYGISVTAVAPGVIDTPQLQADADDLGITIEEVRERYKEEIPLGRLGRAEDIAYLVKYLCKGGNEYFAGSYLQSNGGECRNTTERN